MTANGILQILLFFGLILLLTKPMGAYMARVFDGERTLLQPGAAAGRAALLPPLRRQRRGGHAVDDLRLRHADVQRRRRAAHLCAAAPAGVSAVQSAALHRRADDAGPRRSTRRCRSRPTPTGRTTCRRSTVSYFSNMVALAIAQLDVGGDGHRRRHRARARLRPPLGERASATSGWT